MGWVKRVKATWKRELIIVFFEKRPDLVSVINSMYMLRYEKNFTKEYTRRGTTVMEGWAINAYTDELWKVGDAIK